MAVGPVHLLVCLSAGPVKQGKQSFYSKQFTYIKHLSLWPSSSVVVSTCQ